MIKIIYTLVLLLLSFISSSFSATYYIDNSCKYNGDGTLSTPSAGHGGPGAWNILKASENGPLQPGDTLEIRAGNGIYREATWKPNFSGDYENRIVIQNYLAENVVLEGTIDIKSSAWTHLGNGVYLCSGGITGTAYKFPFTAWYDNGDGEKRLNMIQTNRNADTTLARGFMRYTTDEKIVAHLEDDSNPAGADYFRIPYVNTAIQLNPQEVDYITFRRNPKGGSFVIQRWRDHGITTKTVNLGITYDGLEVCWLMDRGINQVEGGQEDCEYIITNCHIHHCGQEGIRVSQDTSPKGLVAHNHVHHIQTEPIFERTGTNRLPGFSDNGTAIRVANCENITIRKNIVHDNGGGNYNRSYGIDLENGCPGVIVDGNYIYNMNLGTRSPNNGQAILLSWSSEGSSYKGVIVRNNVIRNVDAGITTDGHNDYPLSPDDHIDILNNTLVDVSHVGIQKQDSGLEGPVRIINNIVMAVNTKPLRLIDVGSRGTSGFQTPERNILFYPGGGTLISWKGDKFSEQNLENLGGDNIYGDPQLDLSGRIPTLKIASINSIAIDSGKTVDVQYDYEDNVRPCGSGYDIGAYEFCGELGVDDKNPNTLYPDRFILLQNYPNPFNPETLITFSIPITCQIQLGIYNIRGQLVRTLVDVDLSPGEYRETWNGLDRNGNRVSSGLYVYQLHAEGYSETKKMMLMN